MSKADEAFLQKVSSLPVEFINQLDRLQEPYASLVFSINPLDGCPDYCFPLYERCSDIIEEQFRRKGIENALHNCWAYRVLWDIIDCDVFWDVDGNSEWPYTFKDFEDESREWLKYFREAFHYKESDSVAEALEETFRWVGGLSSCCVLIRIPADYVGVAPEEAISGHLSANAKLSRAGDLWCIVDYPLIADPECSYWYDPDYTLPTTVMCFKPTFIVDVAKKRIEKERRTALC